jgi:hypothetical protein
MSFTRQNIDAAAFFHFPKITSKMRSSLFSFHADVTSDLLESTVDKFGVDKEIKRFPAGTVYKFLKFRLFQQWIPNRTAAAVFGDPVALLKHWLWKPKK